jgi:hypothetical protein
MNKSSNKRRKPKPLAAFGIPCTRFKKRSNRARFIHIGSSLRGGASMVSSILSFTENTGALLPLKASILVDYVWLMMQTAHHRSSAYNVELVDRSVVECIVSRGSFCAQF